MWIREVDFPEPLVEAAQEGVLVLFVGAGASRDSPSDLPDFGTLTSDIAAEANVPLTDVELKQPDLALGRIESLGVDVHHRVAARIGAAGSSPNSLHEAIVELALATRVPRIVTTNYDRHLTDALRAVGEGIPEYRAPALPMGDDFSGLVYLHGSLDQDTRHLVVTDSDFGRAYLRDAWAARFLERMFTTYTVLFIGYSHADVVMRYLARSLTARSRRYALFGGSDASQWRPLNIDVVRYPVDAGSHQALGAGVSGMAQLLSMRLLDHRQRLARLLDGSPPSTPEDISYLEATLIDGERTRMFCELARGEEWLHWAATQPAFRELFDQRSMPSDSSVALCYWLTEQFVASEDLSQTALEVVREAGYQWSPVLWNAVGAQLHRKGSPRPSWLNPWLVLLIENAPPDARDWLEYALVASRLPEDIDAVLVLWDYLTEPVAHLERSFSLGGQPRFAVSVRGSTHWLREAWNDLLRPNLEHVVDFVLLTAERHLRRADHLLRLAGTAQPGWDPVSFGRSSISAHPQDRHGDGLDVLIDAARDCVEKLLDAGRLPPIESWANSDVPILRRLAVFSWTRRADVGDDDRLGWLLGRGWLYEHQLRHEVFELIASALEGASSHMVGEVLEQARHGPGDVEDDDLREYERFNALAWLDRHTDDPATRTAFEAVQEAHPEFQPREHPDLLSWSEIGSAGYQPPMGVDEFHEQLETDVSEAIRQLREFEGAHSPWNPPTWGDATGLVAETVTKYPADGFTIVDAEEGLTTDVSRAVLRGWSRADLSDHCERAADVAIGDHRNSRRVIRARLAVGS
ncbi:MAG: SIR2 family protein [Acidimicrobiia bacterium]